MAEEDHIVRVRCQAIRPAAQLPMQMTPGASGFDLTACLDEPLTLRPGDRFAVPTGLILEIPKGFEGVVRPRSGLALRSGVALVNSPGTIDADYRGELKIILINLGREAVTITTGDRIAQLIIQALPAVRLEWGEVNRDTQRGDGGFGHTGDGSGAPLQ